jgi:hypothetical protein
VLLLLLAWQQQVSWLAALLLLLLRVLTRCRLLRQPLSVWHQHQQG